MLLRRQLPIRLHAMLNIGVESRDVHRVNKSRRGRMGAKKFFKWKQALDGGATACEIFYIYVLFKFWQQANPIGGRVSIFGCWCVFMLNEYNYFSGINLVALPKILL